ncbi:ABC transporter ATP-binding protein [Thiothrix subterranea]|uniref:High-affinity branched-chain amino acid transport ATP-binding protein n=1 Tax=Thiothrix subterranea TaxID=2735563 RepID=A0AA51MPJ6_9GAMM|nr:ABC transporter ATP-binding protein [Thiothrix subterranea]MDQ5768985.1 ABC transporter ATP-binding protein [Thiothrix subterranea]WML86102.1 ABC transporter ATP-binding protein [Thiothrix subterranea]
MSLLSVQNLCVNYDSIRAVKGISFTVEAGETVCLIGANGAGKTTTLKTLSGLLPATSGEIVFDGRKLHGMPAYQIAALKLALVPEGRGIFTRMSVLENLMMGAYNRSDRAAVQREIDDIYTLLPRLAERRQQQAGLLSGGEQQMLALARAMLSKPKLLMLDEPSMGLAPIMVQTIYRIIQTIAQQGITILLIEQNVRLALSISQRGYVMEHGDITLSGAAQTLANDPAVQAAYLGEL